jgi:addiction module RelB/DinJ family antitoxin
MMDEANEILESVGLEMETALKIFIKNIIKTKGFPIDLKQKEAIQEPVIKNKRNIVKINENMIQTVWDHFLILYKGESNVIDLSEEVEKQSGMNKGSAFIYLNILMNMIEGRKNTRNMKVKDFQYFLNRINDEFGHEIFMKSIQSINKSVPYFEVKNPLFGLSIKNLMESYKL